MADDARDCRALGFEPRRDRVEAAQEMHDRRLAPVARAMADVIEEHGLVARRHERRNEGAQLRAAPGPAVRQDHRGAVSGAEAPRSDAAPRGVHREAGAGGEEGELALRVLEPRWCGEDALGDLGRLVLRHRERGGHAQPLPAAPQREAKLAPALRDKAVGGRE